MVHNIKRYNIIISLHHNKDSHFSIFHIYTKNKGSILYINNNENQKIKNQNGIFTYDFSIYVIYQIIKIKGIIIIFVICQYFISKKFIIIINGIIKKRVISNLKI